MSKGRSGTLASSESGAALRRRGRRRFFGFFHTACGYAQKQHRGSGGSVGAVLRLPVPLDAGKRLRPACAIGTRKGWLKGAPFAVKVGDEQSVGGCGGITELQRNVGFADLRLLLGRLQLADDDFRGTLADLIEILRNGRQTALAGQHQPQTIEADNADLLRHLQLHIAAGAIDTLGEKVVGAEQTDALPREFAHQLPDGLLAAWGFCCSDSTSR